MEHVLHHMLGGAFIQEAICGVEDEGSCRDLLGTRTLVVAAGALDWMLCLLRATSMTRDTCQPAELFQMLAPAFFHSQLPLGELTSWRVLPCQSSRFTGASSLSGPSWRMGLVDRVL